MIEVVETKHNNGADTRPQDPNARKLGADRRRKYINHLNHLMKRHFTAADLEYPDKDWVVTQLRCETVALVNALRANHLVNTGKEISKAEVVNALVIHGFSSLIRNESFRKTRQH